MTLVAIGAVERALELARRRVGAVDITAKEGRDLVTATDTNLALVEGGQVTAAVVGDPSTDEIQVAERGRGAWAVKDGARRRLRTSEESRTIVVEDGKSSGARRERAAQFTAAVHPGGSMALPVAGKRAGPVVRGRGQSVCLRPLLNLDNQHCDH